MATYRFTESQIKKILNELKEARDTYYKKKSEKDAESLVPHMNRAILGSLCNFFKKTCLFKDKIGLDESNFKRGDFDEEVRNIFCEWDSQRMNREDATPLA